MATSNIYICVLLSILPINYAQDSFMLAADMINTKIHKIELTSGNVSSLNIPGLGLVTGVDYDSKTRHVYVADYRNRTIHRCTLSGTQCSTFRTGIGYPDRSTIDYSTGNVYYTADASPLAAQPYGYIGIISPSRNAHTYLLSGLRKPRGIALYPSKGLMFWTDHAYPYHHLGRASMDGTNAKVLVNVGTRWPNGITIDYVGDRVYWTDGYYNRIASCDLNGENGMVHFEDPGSHMMDIVMKGSFIYYSAWNRSIITKVERSSFTVSNWMSSAPEFGRIDSVAIHPADVQPNNRMCSNNNGGCHTFCIPTTSTTVVCKCDESLTGSVNNKTCQTEDPTTYCSNTILNGALATDCDRKPGTSCNYNCNEGYKNTKEQTIICLVNGQWSENVAAICQEIRCHINIPHGRFVSQCSGKISEVCFFTCSEGYYSSSGSIGSAYCKTDGQWNTSLTSACQVLRVDSIQSSPQSTAMMGAGVGAGVGVILIIVAVVIAIFVIRKGLHRRLQNERQVQANRPTANTDSEAPPVYYLPDDQVMANPYLTPIDPPPLYDEINSYTLYGAPCYESLEKGSKTQDGTTGHGYATLNETAEANPYVEPCHH